MEAGHRGCHGNLVQRHAISASKEGIEIVQIRFLSTTGNFVSVTGQILRFVGMRLAQVRVSKTLELIQIIAIIAVTILNVILLVFINDNTFSSFSKIY